MTESERAELERLLALRDDDLLPIAGKAWNAVKQPEDNQWIDLPLDIRGKLNHLAEKALSGRSEQEGDYAPAGFFAKVRECGAYPLADPAFIAAVGGRNPILQGQDVVSGDPIVYIDSRLPLEPQGLNSNLFPAPSPSAQDANETE